MIKIDCAKCDVCGDCVEECPVGKLVFVSIHDVGLDAKITCTECQSCITICHNDAISFEA